MLFNLYFSKKPKKPKNLHFEKTKKPKITRCQSWYANKVC